MFFIPKDDILIPVEDNKSTCRHPAHYPPSNLHIPSGKAFRHICPECKKETIIQSTTFIV